MRSDRSHHRILPGLTAGIALALVSATASVLNSQTVPFDATLTSPGGPLRFELRLGMHDDKILSASLVNGAERQMIEEVEEDGTSVRLAFPHYGSEIRAEWNGDKTELQGRWTKRAGSKTTEMPFVATAPPFNRLNELLGRPGSAPDSTTKKFLGRWRVQFESSSDPAVAIFEWGGESEPQLRQVWGTFLTTTGDYRYLAGKVEDDRLELSTFDGAHAFLFHARVTDDGELQGDFWSGTAWHETFTGVRDEQAQLPDGFDEVTWTQQPDWSELMVTDLDGSTRSLAEWEVFGDLTIINVFGSWCPNCHDEAPLLVELERSFRDAGLKVVGLAFEHAGTFDEDAPQVRRYMQRHQIAFPVFLAGLSDKAQATETIGFVDRIKAFPTSIFVNRSGEVIAIYSGFSGPATGKAHDELKDRFLRLIRRELELSDKPSAVDAKR